MLGLHTKQDRPNLCMQVPFTGRSLQASSCRLGECRSAFGRLGWAAPSFSLQEPILRIARDVYVGCCWGAGRVRRPFSSRASAAADAAAGAGAVTLDSM